MLQNAYFLGKIGADTAENEQHASAKRAIAAGARGGGGGPGDGAAAAEVAAASSVAGGTAREHNSYQI